MDSDSEKKKIIDEWNANWYAEKYPNHPFVRHNFKDVYSMLKHVFSKEHGKVKKTKSRESIDNKHRKAWRDAGIREELINLHIKEMGESRQRDENKLLRLWEKAKAVRKKDA
ncbi:hypothetical protein ACFL3E_00485 [Patescibacteria group bacterium]